MKISTTRRTYVVPDQTVLRLAPYPDADSDSCVAEPSCVDRPTRRAPAPGGGEYQARGDGIWWVSGEHELHLANFDAEIVRRARRRDRTELVLRVAVDGRERVLSLSASRYESLRWITAAVSGGVLAAVPSSRARLLAAIALLSSPVEVDVVEQLGWRRDDAGQWQYVHAGGGIGVDGQAALDVQVGPPLDRFVLPSDVVDRSVPLDLLGLAPDRVVVAMLASVVLATLITPTFAIHVAGTTGSGKSQVAAALAASFFGSMATGSDLPVSWASTANAIEAIASDAHGVLVVDDWVPATAQGSEVEMDRVLRGAANSGGRARLGSPARAPRAMIVSTGEAVPELPSLLARMIVLRLDRGDVDWAKLTVAQQAARAGVHASWLAGFVAWAATRLDDLRARLDDAVVLGRARWSRCSVHARTVDALAHLDWGWRLIVDYVAHHGDLSGEEASSLLERGDVALVELARDQERLQLAGDPARHFVTVLRSLIAAGTIAVRDDARDSSDRHGASRVAWRRDAEVLIDPAAAVDVVVRHLATHGGRLDLSEQQIGARLHARGLLTRVDRRGSKVRFAVRATVGGQRRRVWVFRAETLGV